MSTRKERCAALDQDGKRCRRYAVRFEHYHGDSQIYRWDGVLPAWVRVALCGLHSRPKVEATR